MDLGPMDVFVGWQALLLAAAVYMLTQLGKTIVDVAYASRVREPSVESTEPAPEEAVAAGDGPYRTSLLMPEKMARKVAKGAAIRKQSRGVTRIVLPAIPPILGAALALVLPLPDSLAAWVDGQVLWLGLVARGAWGAAAGQFADYSYSKLKALVMHAPAGEGGR